MSDADRSKPTLLDQTQLAQMFSVLEKVAQGDFSSRIEPGRAQEWSGLLAARLNMMIDDLEDALEQNRRQLKELGQINHNLDQIVTERTKELQERLDHLTEQNKTIQRQQAAIQELSTPILQIWPGVLALPVIGIVDTKRSLEIMERLLNEIVEKQTRFVILDITGVEVVDTKTADYFIKVIRAAELLGTTCLVTGIRPMVAQTLVDLGVDLTSMRTHRNLQEGLQECLREISETFG